MKKRGVFVLSILILLLTTTLVDAGVWSEIVTGAATRRLSGGEESTPNCVISSDCPRGEICSGRRCVSGTIQSNNSVTRPDRPLSNVSNISSRQPRPARNYSLPEVRVEERECYNNEQCEDGKICVDGSCINNRRRQRPLPERPPQAHLPEEDNENVYDYILGLFRQVEEASQEANSCSNHSDCPEGKYCLNTQCTSIVNENNSEGAERPARRERNNSSNNQTRPDSPARESSEDSTETPSDGPGRGEESDSEETEDPVCVMAAPEYCYEGATCCFGGYWRCNNGDGSSACPAIPTGEVVDNNETRPELHRVEPENRTLERVESPRVFNIRDLIRRIFGNGGDGDPDETADPSLCTAPSPRCREGASCCPNGVWRCNRFDGTPNCPDTEFFDQDNDGYYDGIDNCREDYNPEQIDSDSDGEGDVCEEDNTCITHDDCSGSDKCYVGECIASYNWIIMGIRDGDYDGILNTEDNCREDYNPEQIDSDSDGEGDVCEDVINSTVDIPSGTTFRYENIDTPEKMIVVINDLDVDNEYNHWNRMIDFTISRFDGEELYRFQPWTDFNFCLLPNWRCTGGGVSECDSAGRNCVEKIPTELDLMSQGILWLYPNPETSDMTLEEIRANPDYNFNFFEIPIHETLTEYNVVVRTGRWEEVSFTLSEATGMSYPLGSVWSQKEEFWYYCDENLYYSRYTFPVGGDSVAPHESGTIVIRLSDFIPSDGLFESGGYC